MRRLDTTQEKLDKIKVMAKDMCSKLSHDDMIVLKGQISHQMVMKDDRVSDNIEAGKYFCCMLSGNVLPKKYGKKIETIKRTRYHVEKSWFYLSRSEYNKIYNIAKA